MADYKTGTCFVGGRPHTRLLKDGTVGMHSDKRKAPTWRQYPRCSGWGKPPKES